MFAGFKRNNYNIAVLKLYAGYIEYINSIISHINLMRFGEVSFTDTTNEKSIKKNFIYSTFYQILTMILPLITTPYVSRVLGADGIGTYSYTSSLQTYFSLFAALGVLSYGQREISRNRDDAQKRSRLFWEIELMVVATTTVTLAVWLIFSFCYIEYTMFFVILSINIVAVVFDVSWFFSGLEEFQYIVIKNTIVKLARVGLLFILIREKGDLLLYIGLMAGGTLAGNISMWTKLPKFVKKVPLKTLHIHHHIKESFIYFIPTIATSVYTVLDKTMIGIITNNSYENGYYEQATKIINMAKALAFTSLNSVMGARTAYLFKENRTAEVHKKIEDSLNYIILMSVGMCFGLIGVADGLVPWFFGNGYEAVAGLLKLFSPIIVIVGISNCLGSLYYSPVGKRATSAKFIICGSVCNLIFNMIFIPKLGATGAALGSLFAETIITVLYIAFSDGYATVAMLVKLSWKRIVAAIGMLMVVLQFYKLLQATMILTIVQLFAGVAVYAVILLILRDEYVIRLTEELLLKVSSRLTRQK